MSDFSLMDAIECGIVKLPRVPVAENIPGDEMPMFRNLWEHIRKDMPKKGRGKGGELDPLKLPTATADRAQALYGHYEKTFKLWEDSGHPRAALLHHRLPQHLDLEAGLRLHLRLPPQERGRHDHARERPPRAVPQLRRDTATRSRARTRCSSTASSSKPAMRSTTTSAAWPPTRSSASAARSSSAPAMPAPARTSPTRNCCARS